MKIISHRGKIDSINSDENKINSVLNFMQTDIVMIEIDIQLTLDNKIIVYHDQKINVNNSCFFELFI